MSREDDYWQRRARKLEALLLAAHEEIGRLKTQVLIERHGVAGAVRINLAEARTT